MKKVIDWISDHDNKTSFVILYIGLSLVLSIAISLFWLLIAVIFHFVFELFSQSRKQNSTASILIESVWETKLDFALVLFAYVLAIYLDFVFGVAGIGAIARVSAQSASRVGTAGSKAAEVSVRFAAWNRIIRTILLSLDDVGNAIKSVYQGKKSREKTQNTIGKKDKTTESSANLAKSNNESTEAKNGSPKKAINSWQVIDYIGVILFVLCLLLLIFAPVIINVSFQDVLSIGAKEFTPFPS